MPWDQSETGSASGQRVARKAERPDNPTPRRGLGLIIEEAPHAYHVFVSTLPS